MNHRKNIKTAMITGASKGIGLELTKKLTDEGWDVIALIRSNFSENEEEIHQKINHKQIRVYKADLTNFDELRSTLTCIKEKEEVIDALFNNAGGSFDKLYYSPQSRELHFEIHTVVPYIILTELIHLLKKGTNRIVINTSTNAFSFINKISYPEIIHPKKKFKKLFGPYATSKLALSLWTHEISADLLKQDIRILSVDPGGNNTVRKGGKSGLPFFIKIINSLFFPPPSKGANVLYQAAFEKTSLSTGAYVTKGKGTPLKHLNHSPRILKDIQLIYHHDFLKQTELKQNL